MSISRDKWRRTSEQRRAWNKQYQKKRQRLVENAQQRKRSFRCQLPEQLLAIMQRMVTETLRSGKYAFQSMGECGETLIRRGIGTYEHEHAAVDAAWPAIQVATMLQTVEQQRRTVQSMVTRLQTEVNEFKAIGAETSALQYYHVVVEAIHKMPPTAHRDWALAKLKKDFPEFARHKKAPGVVIPIAKRKHN